MAFVKFSRGLISTYNNLNRKDPDTLYLVYENENSASGSLYLGTKLISSVSSGVSATALSDLTDVTISGTLQDGMLLQYNASTGNGIWEAVPLSDVISGAGGGGNANISIVEALNEISSPSEKDLAVVGTNLYIYDGSEWVQLTDTSLASRVSDLESSVGHAADVNQNIPATGLYADIAAIETQLGNIYTKSEIAEQIAAAQHLRYQIVSDIEDIDVTDEEAEYTVYLVPKSDSETNDEYDEYFVIDEVLEKIGNWSVDLSDYVQTDDNRLLTQEQKTKLNAINLDANDNLTITSSQVSDLSSALANAQYIKSVQSGVFTVTQAGELQLSSIPSGLLDDYVTQTEFTAIVGNLDELNDRVSEDSTIVDEINSIKESIIWRAIPSNEE